VGLRNRGLADRRDVEGLKRSKKTNLQRELPRFQKKLQGPAKNTQTDFSAFEPHKKITVGKVKTRFTAKRVLTTVSGHKQRGGIAGWGGIAGERMT